MPKVSLLSGFSSAVCQKACDANRIRRGKTQRPHPLPDKVKLEKYLSPGRKLILTPGL